MIQCYQCKAESSETRANFCTQCGVPLRQPCPHDPSHQTPVKGAGQSMPRACAVCGQLLRACAGCGRLHRPNQETCLTRRCSGRALPPPAADWSAYGGGPGRRGAVRGDRAPQAGLENYRAWELPDLPGRRTHAVSAYGTLYLATDTRLTAVDEPGKPPLQWPAVNLPWPVREERGALFAERGYLFVLTEGGAAVYAAAQLGAVRQPLPGTFLHQMVGARTWWLFEDSGPGAARLREVALSDLGTLPRETALVSAPTAPPVLCGDHLYWGAGDGRLYRWEDGAARALAEAEGPIVAAAASDPESGAAGVCFISRSAQGEHRLHFLEHARPGYTQSVRIPAAAVEQRLWTADRQVVVATPGTAGQTPALLSYDQRALGQEPQRREWPRGQAFVDALLFQAPRELFLVLAQRQESLGAVVVSARTWQGEPIQLGRIMGAGETDLLFHRGLVTAVVASTLEGQPLVRVRAFRLWNE
jgi:hypothetical protein